MSEQISKKRKHMLAASTAAKQAWCEVIAAAVLEEGEVYWRTSSHSTGTENGQETGRVWVGFGVLPEDPKGPEAVVDETSRALGAVIILVSIGDDGPNFNNMLPPFDPDEWDAFIAGGKNDEFNL